ncbi:hypothetical protein HOY80DRAFT_945764 [Tuber brumale]|nr:hypothetical protein HOY80DRAFT_945764 [Tuber brumale]
MAASLSQIAPALFVFFFIGILLVVGFCHCWKASAVERAQGSGLARIISTYSQTAASKLGVKNDSHEEYMDRMKK